MKFDGLEAAIGFRNLYVVGAPLTIAKLYHNLGVDPETGLYQFEDYNNDGAITIDDKQWIQDTAPKFYGGLGNNITYKNWTLDVFLNFKKQKSTGDLFLERSTPGTFVNQHVSALDRWQQVGDEAHVQSYVINPGISNNRHYESSALYTDTSFIRLKTISLNYDLPKDALSGFNASIYLQGQNLFYVYTTKYASDPEQLTGGSWMPSLRQLTMGIQLGF